MGYGYYHHGFFGGEILMALFWVLIIILIIKLVSRSRWGHNHTMMGGPWQRKDDAMELLKTRYVKGEINKQEFEEKKKDLSS